MCLAPGGGGWQGGGGTEPTGIPRIGTAQWAPPPRVKGCPVLAHTREGEAPLLQALAAPPLPAPQLPPAPGLHLYALLSLRRRTDLKGAPLMTWPYWAGAGIRVPAEGHHCSLSTC